MKAKWRRMTTEELVATFVELGVDFPTMLLDDGEVKKQNAFEKDIWGVGKTLKSRGAEGEAALVRLMDHPHICVRLHAARNSIWFAKTKAVEVLKPIMEMNAGSISMIAQMSLMFAGEFDMKANSPPEWEWKGGSKS